MKLYVAGPMTGLPDFNYPAFHAAADDLRAFGYEPLNPCGDEPVPPAVDEAHPWDWYMRKALALLLTADGLALLPNWWESRGASLEVHVAASLRMPIAAVVDWKRAAR